MRYLILFCLNAVLLVSCGGSPAATPDQALVETAKAQIMASAMETANAELLATNTPISTQLPASAESPPPDKQFALNYLGSQDRGGVVVEIARVLVGDKVAVGNDINNSFDYCEAFKSTTVVVEIVFRVTNNTDQVISIYPDQGTVVIGNEQINLIDFLFCGQFGDDFSGDIFPGVTAIGGMWLGIKRSSVADVNSMIISFSGPSDQNYNSLGPDYYFELDISNHIFEELPAELQ